ncbi:RHS repeat domain-containing protein [Aestuariibaculum sediminum]|uniref:YD repeat-containing protein n=1 Tax=Aestuariibaculum sediminum TaxID=2770637 RepID=A0A8J6UCX7_9FLAO|nr:RHS repeat domain-containing protein [Aestuariibaculum sediminum]MBD0832529.1 hypothetical protein [Aestuariibaculum sediminum]
MYKYSVILLLFFLWMEVKAQEFKSNNTSYSNTILGTNYKIGEFGEVTNRFDLGDLEHEGLVAILNPSHQEISKQSLNYQTISYSGTDNYYLDENGPSDMTDKYSLKPSPGQYMLNAIGLNDDLFNGKVNITIPFFEYTYFDYKIPISINNRYPQNLKSTFGEPVFYTNSDIGGDWSLSLDQFKVSRQVNGIEDEHPTKGYFSAISQSKFSTPISISDSDVHSGLKGDWDPQIDIFYYSTPSFSGSFHLDLLNGGYEIVSGPKVHIEYQLENNAFVGFEITDNTGVKYLFGIDSNAIEVSQSKTDLLNLGRYRDPVDGGFTVTHLFEVVNNNVISIADLPSNANLFADTNLPSVVIPPTVQEALYQLSINENNFSALNQNWFSHLGNGIYGIVDYYSWDNNNLQVLPNGDKKDDAELRRDKINSGWYLKEIKLLNNKKISFNYINKWEAYRTHAANKIKIDVKLSNRDFTYQYIGNNQVTYNLSGLSLYGCFPEELTWLQFPINESHTTTTHFVKKPKLYSITDDDNFSEVLISRDSGNPKGYVSGTSLYANAPTETIETPNIGLISKISLSTSNSSDIKIVEFNNFSEFTYYTEQGVTYRVPEKDRTFLEEVTLNRKHIGTVDEDFEKKYDFEYVGSRLKKIHYPTGATKEFYSTDFYHSGTREYLNFTPFTGQSGYVNARLESVVDSIITTNENKSTIEKYVYSNPYYALGRFKNFKTYRPDITTCTSSAEFYSTNPLYTSSVFYSGVGYGKVDKYFNNELQISKEFLNSEAGTPFVSLRLTDNTNPDYLDLVGYPIKSLGEIRGLESKVTSFVTKSNGEVEPIEEITFNRKFGETKFVFPSFYLTKIEAGPWQNTNGAIKRAWSLCGTPVEYYITEEEKHVKSVFENQNIETKEINYFKRTRYPDLGLNNYRLLKKETYNNEQDFYQTVFNSPIELENLQEINFSFQIKNSVFNNLLSTNRVPVIERTLFHNDVLLDVKSAQFETVQLNGSDIALLHSEKTMDLNSLNAFVPQKLDPNNYQNILFDSGLSDEIVYEKYDNDGKLIEYSNTKSGFHTCIIWGYKNQYPIAKIENATFEQGHLNSITSEQLVLIDDAVSKSNTDYLVGSEISLRNSLQALREGLPKAMVTSYTYDPLIGITSETDPRGDIMRYEYDDFGRLKYMKDLESKILSKHEYHYKGQ